MRSTVENDKFDIWMEPSDWRYAAAIVGLSRYLKYFGDENEDYEISDEYLKFRSTDITEERYLEFVEAKHAEELQHKRLETLLSHEELSRDGITFANELIKGNSVMKKVFGKQKFDGSNQEALLELIQGHRKELIKETFRNKSNMYANFANTGQLFEGAKQCCRLHGYCVDGGRKSKSISYNFDTSTFVAQDDPFFDFIPFAFYGDREVFFINDNYSVKQLIATNNIFKELLQAENEEGEKRTNNARKVLFKSIQEAADFINYDTEVIIKKRDKAFFETMYIRRKSIRILKDIKVYEPFCFSIKVNDNYYIDVQNKVTDCILNLVRADEVIELLLKQSRDKVRGNPEYVISQLININYLICGGKEDMKQSMKVAYACAKAVAEKLPENKRASYRQKLISAVVFKDYDRCCQILLQLSNYANVDFDFVYALFEDFEGNKDIAYTFINALTKKNIRNAEEN